MTIYRTLVPITYQNGNMVVTAVAGARVDLTPAQALALQGSIVLDPTNNFTYPKVDVLWYDYQALFPLVGTVNVLYFGADTGLVYRWSQTSQTYVAVGVPTSWASIDTDERDDLLAGESTMSRRYITGSGTVALGSMYASFFTARKTETITQVRTVTGPTAQSGATLCRVGLFSVDSAGNLYLVASTANDTTLWAAANTAYTKVFSSSVLLTRGNRYAVGVLQVGGTAVSLAGNTAVLASEAFQPPALSAKVPSLSDLPSSVVAANLTATSVICYASIMP